MGSWPSEQADVVAFAWLGDNACAERGPRLGVVSSDVSGGGLSDVVGEPLERQHHLPTYYLPTYLHLSMISAFAVRDGPPLATIVLQSCVRPFGCCDPSWTEGRG